ncbi:MAG: hypothetical protein MUP55_00680 [Candidatus Aenigmarchaeota archaeon]|nr:hypothetical protein [Candidatus Aenigmarchaeota archaeon]
MKTITKLTDAKGVWLLVQKKPVRVHALELTEPVHVKSKEGLVTGKKGDFLMRGIEGELYICDARIFQKTYEVMKVLE